MNKLKYILITLLFSAQAYAANIAGSITVNSASCIPTACVQLHFPDEASTVVARLTGTFSATVQFEATNDSGSSWAAIVGYPVGAETSGSSATAAGAWQFAVPGMTDFRVRCSSYASGTVSVSLSSSRGSASIASGTNALALETGGNLADIQTQTEPLTQSDAGGYIRQDSNATIATETTVSAINTKLTSGTDIGDVTINNVAGSAAYVQPGTGAQFTTVPATADAEPAAGRTNPPIPIGGEDYGSGCDSGPCVQIPKVDSSGNVYVKTSLATADGAEGAAPTNPPVPIAGRADSTEKAAVDDGDSAIPVTDLVGRLVTKGFCTPGNEVWDYVNITNNTETEVLAGAGASNYMYITFLSVISTGTTETEVIFYDDDACDGGGTALFGAHVSDDPPSGVVIGNGDQPVLKVTTANQKFCVKAITTGADIHITTKGCKSTQ